MRTHYDVLKLEKNCSAKEIKEAFISLSKKYHPDKNKSSDAHKKFVEVNEAYSVLGKASSRHSYDETLSFAKSSTIRTNSTYKSYTTTKTANEYYTEMYGNNFRRQQGANQNYFSRSKLNALYFCLLVMVIGSGLQIMAISQRRATYSHQIASMLKEAREKRIQNEQRLREMREAIANDKSNNLNQGEQ